VQLANSPLSMAKRNGPTFLSSDWCVIFTHISEYFMKAEKNNSGGTLPPQDSFGLMSHFLPGIRSGAAFLGLSLFTIQTPH